MRGDQILWNWVWKLEARWLKGSQCACMLWYCTIMFKYNLPYTYTLHAHLPVEEEWTSIKMAAFLISKLLRVAEVVQTGPNTHRILLGLGKGHYWKILQPSKALWLLLAIGCLSWQQWNNKVKTEGNQKRLQDPVTIGRGIGSTGTDFLDPSSYKEEYSQADPSAQYVAPRLV